MPRKPPSKAQMAWNKVGAHTMRKNGISRARQIASQRTFTYDGALQPTCLACGQPRQDRRGLHCDRCR